MEAPYWLLCEVHYEPVAVSVILIIIISVIYIAPNP